MGWASAKKLTVLFLVPLAGCAEEAEPAPADAVPASLLVQESDFPAGVEARKTPNQPCSPVPYLKGQGAKVAVSSLFKTGSTGVVEALGIAPSVEGAQEALDSLHQEARVECIGEAIAQFGPEEGVSVKFVAPVPIGAGEGGSLMRFREVDEAAKPLNVTAAASFRSGRCVASLLVLVKGSEVSRPFIDRVADRAEKRLARAHSTCR